MHAQRETRRESRKDFGRPPALRWTNHAAVVKDASGEADTDSTIVRWIGEVESDGSRLLNLFRQVGGARRRAEPASGGSWALLEGGRPIPSPRSTSPTSWATGTAITTTRRGAWPRSQAWKWPQPLQWLVGRRLPATSECSSSRATRTRGGVERSWPKRGSSFTWRPPACSFGSRSIRCRCRTVPEASSTFRR